MSDNYLSNYIRHIKATNLRASFNAKIESIFELHLKERCNIHVYVMYIRLLLIVKYPRQTQRDDLANLLLSDAL